MDILETLRRGEEEIPFEVYNWPDVDTLFMTTDTANQYILHLISEKNAQGRKLAMTEGIIISDNNPSTIFEACQLLSDKYESLLDEYKSLEGVYTVVNAAPSMKYAAHQNWLYFDVEKEIIIRYEPNGPDFDKNFADYPLKDFLNCVKSELGVNWRLADNKTINYFNGCRATSTILALLDMLGIDLNKLDRIRKEHYRGLAYQVSLAAKRETCKMPMLPRRGRRQKGLLTYKAPVIRGEDEIIPLDFPSMKVNEIKNYLRKQGILILKGEKKQDLVKKAMKVQNEISVV